MTKKDICCRKLVSHEVTLYLQSWRKAPGWWRGGWPCQRADLAPPYHPEKPQDPLTLLHWAWWKHTNTWNTCYLNKLCNLAVSKSSVKTWEKKINIPRWIFGIFSIWFSPPKKRLTEGSESHLSVSGSRKTSSLSSPVPAAPGTTRLGVDVLTVGTDWEACSVVSDWTTSEKTVTGREMKTR